MNRFTLKRTWNRHWLSIVAVIAFLLVFIVTFTPAFASLNYNDPTPQVDKSVYCQLSVEETKDIFVTAGLLEVATVKPERDTNFNDLFIFTLEATGEIVAILGHGPCVVEIFSLEN